jgi:hypothetical protein
VFLLSLFLIITGCSPTPNDLFDAIDKGNIARVKRLSSDKKLINSIIWEEGNSFTPIKAALIADKIQIAIILIEAGADITITDDTGYTAFCWATTTGNLNVMKCIYKHQPNVDINHIDDWTYTPLITAAKKDYNKIICWLLTLPGIKVNAQTKHGFTALGWSAYDGNLEAVKMLLAKGADINLINVKGQSIIDFAKGSLKKDWSDKQKKTIIETIKYLKAHGAKSAADLKTQANHAKNIFIGRIKQALPTQKAVY